MKHTHKFGLIAGLLLLTLNMLWAANFYHDVPSAVYQGENLHIELKDFGYSPTAQPPMLYYRMTGEFDFHALPLKNEGFVYAADIPGKLLHPGRVQYYFAMETTSGSVATLPDGAPYSQLYEVEVIPNNSNRVGRLKKIDINLLAPQENEILNPDEVFISFSVPYSITDPNKLKFRITMDGIDRTEKLVREGHVATYIPNSIRSGYHTVSFKVYNADGILIGQRQVRFRVSDMPSVHQAFSYKGSFFVDNRIQELNATNLNYTRGGVRLNLNYKKFELDTRLLLTTNESRERQPLNIYSMRFKYNFSYRYFLYLWGGDVSPTYDPLTLQGRRIRGGSVGLYTRFFNLDVTKGQSLRAIEGLAPVNPDSSTIPLRRGTFRQNFFSVNPQFNFGSHFSWGLNLLNAKDDPNSIKYGPNPKEYLVVGTTFDLNMHGRRILIHGSAQASIKNEDASHSVDFDTLANSLNLEGSDRSNAKRIVDLLTKPGFITISPGLAPLPSLALQFDTQLNYFNQVLRFSYKRIDANYATPGNPYLLKDLQGFFINDYLRLLNNRMFMNIFFNSYETNRSQGKAKTKNKDFGITLALTTQSNLPSVSLNYINYDRKNNVQPTDSLLFPENNVTQSIGLAGSYNFNFGLIRNTLSLSANHFLRDDKFKTTQNQYNLISVGLRNRFAIPLTSRFAYSTSATDFGTGLAKQSTDIRRYSFGLEYLFRNFVFGSQMKPFLNGSVQKIKNSALGNTYQRQNYTVGISWITSGMGTLNLRYDYISYDFQNARRNDSILSTRYNLFF